MLCVVDEFTREAPAIRVDRRLRSADVIEPLAERMLERGAPAHIRSDNGPEFAARAVRNWVSAVGGNTAHVEPGSPWENGCVESFDSKPRDEPLDGEILRPLKEAQILIEAWRGHHNAIRPHSALGWRPPAPQVRAAAPLTWPARDPLNRTAKCATIHRHSPWIRDRGPRPLARHARLPDGRR